MIFRIIDDTIELDGLPVATILPSVWPTRRDYLEQTLESYEPKTESELRDERDELKARIDELTTENIGLKNRVDDLENEVYDLENAQ
jgi:predicted RNase H-like nuclease (RuvC/YqgF family)